MAEGRSAFFQAGVGDLIPTRFLVKQSGFLLIQFRTITVDDFGLMQRDRASGDVGKRFLNGLDDLDRRIHESRPFL